LIIGLLFIAGQAMASEAEDMFRHANQEYRNENYSAAAEIYEKLIGKGYKTADIYYNLGNTYFKQKQIAPAILNYERALRLKPGDEDIRFNLRIAKLRTVDKIDKLPRLFIWEWLDAAQDMFGSGVWAWLTVAFLWITFVLLVIFFINWRPAVKKLALFAAAAAFVIAIASFSFAWSSYSGETARNRGIIFSPSVYVKSSPDKDGTDLFILHEGTKVRTLDSVGKWLKIRLADGNVGWIPQKSIEII
jgi:tetratricopeptide (TPR) repeat protein